MTPPFHEIRMLRESYRKNNFWWPGNHFRIPYTGAHRTFPFHVFNHATAIINPAGLIILVVA